jgi:tetratricopeptide (TPR) repeat protein
MAGRTSLRAVALIMFVAFSITTGSSNAQEEHDEHLDTLNQQVMELYRAAKYEEGIEIARRALALAERQHGPDHPNVAIALDNLTAFHWAQGRYDEAEALYKRALAIDEKALGPDHPSVGTHLNNLALLYWGQGRYDEAEPLMQRALAIHEKALGSDHPDVGTDLNALARLYQAQGHYPDAEPLYKRALGIDEKALGPDHPDVGTRLNNLALPYETQGRYSEAEPLLKRALGIDEKALGPDHPNVAIALNNLGELYRVQGRYGEAEALYKRALAIDEKALGPEHANAGTAVNNLALLYWAEGRYGEAEPLMQRALAIHEKALGPDHPNLGTDLNNLARLYEDQGKLKDAEPFYQRAIAIAEKALGPDHPNVALMRSNLGGLYKSQGRYGEAEPLLKSALEINEKVFGPTRPEIANSLTQLGDLYRLQGKCDQAQPLFLRARSFGSTTIEEVPVLFGTDRKRDLNQPSVTFGGERDEKMSFGLAIVTVPKEQAAIEGYKPITEARHLAMHCIEVVGDQQIVATAVHQIDVARTYPAQALIFVHGYNVSFESAARRVAQIAYDIQFDGAAFLFSWPSQERMWGYLSDSDTVNIAADHLSDFLKKIVAETKVRKIHFVAHSMGNMVLLRALERVTRENPSLRELIGEIIEAAPDVDQGVYAHMLQTINPDGGRTFTLYASRGDWALWLSGWLRGLARAGYIGKDKPLIVPGVDTIDISEAGTSLFSLNHDLYSSNRILVADMRRIIEKSERPPDKRTRELEPITSSDGTYWRLVLSRSEVRRVATHVLTREELLRERPAPDATGERKLRAGDQVSAVKFVGDWAMIARDGQMLGYVPADALVRLQ